jgi:hypothetical protein
MLKSPAFGGFSKFSRRAENTNDVAGQAQVARTLIVGALSLAGLARDSPRLPHLTARPTP